MKRSRSEALAAVSTLAGSRESKNGYADGPAADARFDCPKSVAIDAEGNIVVADSYNHCIRKVTLDGTVSTLAGSRESDDGFADGPAAECTSACRASPRLRLTPRRRGSQLWPTHSTGRTRRSRRC